MPALSDDQIRNNVENLRSNVAGSVGTEWQGQQGDSVREEGRRERGAKPHRKTVHSRRAGKGVNNAGSQKNTHLSACAVLIASVSGTFVTRIPPFGSITARRSSENSVKPTVQITTRAWKIWSEKEWLEKRLAYMTDLSHVLQRGTTRPAVTMQPYSPTFSLRSTPSLKHTATKMRS